LAILVSGDFEEFKEVMQSHKERKRRLGSSSHARILDTFDQDIPQGGQVGMAPASESKPPVAAQIEDFGLVVVGIGRK
jgi:hypothetical protein